ncbi:4-hydroxy-tetrahydrodipicolinate reductase [Ruania rhizosphaerae]|uniref:4-hydroxy-tetrahydrodipicolinate reductase n=1 Tax=Ruania rhizosphaerae TaxID=1840413 RepID=UPI00135A3B12|nr:4-hydroxy-tetrahydrodipicolinate reductase [Ruania rhizosphaerae]
MQGTRAESARGAVPAGGSPVRVAVLGAAGRMGSTVCGAVEEAPDMELVARLDVGDDIEVLAGVADVAVDFTVPSAAESNVHALIDAGVHPVVGTTGWDEPALDRVREHLGRDGRGLGALIAPNFALSAVLAMQFAAQAARYFESVEIIELHHPNKVDAPSGTAVHTAQAVARAREGMPMAPDATQTCLDGARGARVHGIPVHAVRLQGLVAHEEILLGNAGEQLTIRTDSFERSSFMPGVLLAVRTVSSRPGLAVGLDAYLDLGR